ncbi:MAG: cytochrome c biogenesis protein CcdA [Eubacteriales bacterium]|nr:cytochrome c biogenesis protein CcdA [Eubacteriales bacterium]
MNGVLDVLARIMADNLWAAPVLSLAAGIITSFTPCSLATVPMLLACVGATNASPKKAFRLSLAMACGMAATFGIFGSVASAIGHRMHEAGHWWTALMGILMILMALQVFGLVHIIPHIHMSEKMTKKGYAGAFLTGALGGVFASHCAIPVMVALLALVAELGKNAWWGVFLMVLYALGHSILLIAAGTGYSYVEKAIENPKFESAGKWLRRFLGVVILAVGLLMIFGEK